MVFWKNFTNFLSYDIILLMLSKVLSHLLVLRAYCKKIMKIEMDRGEAGRRAKR